MIVSTRCNDTRVTKDPKEDEITLTLPSSLVFITADDSEDTPEYDIGLDDFGDLHINGFSFKRMLRAYTLSLATDIHGEIVSGEEVLRRGQNVPGDWRRGEDEYLVPQEYNTMEAGVFWSFRTSGGDQDCIDEESSAEKIAQFEAWVKSAPWTFSSDAYWNYIRNRVDKVEDQADNLPF